MFRRAIVVDIITHPNILSEQLLNSLDSDRSEYVLTRKKNRNFLKKLPRNSIIGMFVQSKERFIAIPFFSSHIGFPLKPNEEVWIFEDETLSNKNNEIEYFWMSRIHGLNLYEDANYSHPDRKYFLKNNIKTQISQIENLNEIVTPVFNNGPVRDKSYNISQSDVEDAQKLRIKSLNISGQYLLEDIPRVTKNPGDFIIQGSNNTLIKLGTSSSILQSNDFINIEYNKSQAQNKIDPYSGCIDLVAGRAAFSQTLGVSKQNINYTKDGNTIFSKSVATKAYRNSFLPIYNEKGYIENVKDSEYYLGSNRENLAEGDSDFYTDISRIFISEYSNGDELLNYNSTFYIDQSGNQFESDKTLKRGFIIGKSDEIRLVARQGVIARNRYDFNKLEYNNAYEEKSGSIKLIKEGNDDSFSYINLEENGSIAIDAPMIVIGDKKRIKENGTGDSIYLGNDSHEPGVLGYMLKNKLENFMDETIRALNIIGLCLKDLDTHVHIYLGPSGQTLGPLPGPTTPSTLPNFIENTNFQTWPDLTNTNARERSGSPDDKTGNYGKVNGMGVADSKKLEDKINDIVKIRESLNDILSKFVKTL